MTRRAQAVSVATAIAAVLVIAAVVAMSRGLGIGAVGELTRDPLRGRPWWAGSLGIITWLLWSAAATLCLSAGMASPNTWRRPFIWLGVLCAALGLDDSLRLHESLPGFGIPQLPLFALYGVTALALAFKFLSALSTAVGRAFFTGAAMLALSLLWDEIHPLTLYVVEDGAKLFGVAFWILCGAWGLQDALAETRDTSS
ncbi:MAG TPA: hypothetical protein VEY33_01905 [Gemmatimonadota bacterium]|nr:hypothetical protein [Gemmatimonadota bacterium]